VQLSILMPTHRDGLQACSRIAQACSWAGPNIEVIVRDNSGTAQKRELLGHLRRDNCNIIIAEPCDGLKNFSEVLRLAKGEFVFLLADDDFCFDHAIAALPAILAKFGNDPAVAGVTGAYVVDGARGSSVASYKDVEADDAGARVAGYLGYGGPNILHYAPMRRALVQRVFKFMNTLPFYFSFHDQIISLLYLLNGKFVRLQRLMYLYDCGVWQETESAQKRDVDFYRDAGLDPAINKLHWFLCGFEGAALTLNSDVFPDFPRPQRQAIADRWFVAMFGRFKGHARLTYESKLADEAEKLCAKLRAAAGLVSFHNMLAEICSLVALSSKAQAQTYFDYWDAVLNKRQPSLRKTGS
jgi:Glycosyl transferase family 2